MTNEVAQTKGNYLTDLQKLDGATLRSFVDPKHQASPQELQTLLAIVKNRNLNPFTREVYFIKYGNNPAQIVVSKDAFIFQSTHPCRVRRAGTGSLTIQYLFQSTHPCRVRQIGSEHLHSDQ